MSFQGNTDIKKLDPDFAQVSLLPENSSLHPNALSLEDENNCLTTAEGSWICSKARVLKNLSMILIGTFLAYAAYEALRNLQSTINPTENVGIYSLAVVYASSCLSCFLLPPMIIKKLGCKTTIVLGFLGHLPYIAANFHPRWWTLLPTAVLCGIVSGPLHAARCAYINKLSFQYATRVKDSISVVTSFFFGIGFMSYQGAQIFGNIISYFILKPSRNETYIDRDALDTCGARFCNMVDESNSISTNSNLDLPPDEQRFILVGVLFICSALAACVTWLFLDGISPENVGNKETKSTKLIFAAFNQLKKKKQLLLVPLMFHVGLSDGFLSSDFTKAYIGCAWKIYHVGYVIMAYGMMSALMSVVVPFFVKYFGRIAVFLVSSMINATNYIFLLIWNPSPDSPIVFFLIAGAWGCVDAVWWSQIVALHGMLFKTTCEAAFSVFFFVTACGFLVAYAYEGIFCTHVKIYILLFAVIVGVLGYMAVEYTSDTTTSITSNEDSTRQKEICSQQEILSEGGPQ